MIKTPGWPTAQQESAPDAAAEAPGTRTGAERSSSNPYRRLGSPRGASPGEPARDTRTLAVGQGRRTPVIRPDGVEDTASALPRLNPLPRIPSLSCKRPGMRRRGAPSRVDTETCSERLGMPPVIAGHRVAGGCRRAASVACGACQVASTRRSAHGSRNARSRRHATRRAGRSTDDRLATASSRPSGVVVRGTQEPRLELI